MLKQRVVTAVVLTVLIFSAVLFFPALGFQLFIGVFWLIASWEWSRISGITKLPVQLLYSFFFFVLMFVVSRVPESHVYLMLVSLVWWLYAFYLVMVYPRHSATWSSKPVMVLSGLLVLLPSWVALMQLRLNEHFVFLFLVLFLIVTSVDIGAFFTGRAFGKNKLAPDVSPNKTWEGFWGGVCLSMLMSVAVSLFLLTQNYLDNVLAVIPIVLGCVFIAVLSVVGDLFESMCKRTRGIKDSGSILPGHGGILDRIDSVTAAVPVYILLLIFLEARLL